MPRTVIPAVTLILILPACRSEGTASSSGRTLRDSAGVALVTMQTAPDRGTSGVWRAGGQTVVAGDDPALPLGRVSDLAVDDEGRVYVLDQLAQVVWVFAPGHGLVGSMGGPGEGPGELGPLVTSVLVRGDTVLVADWTQARLSLFSTDGATLGTDPIPVEGGTRTWWASSRAGLYFRGLTRFTDERGRWSGRDVLFRYDDRGRADTVLTFEYPESDFGTRSDPNLPITVNAPSWTVLDDGSIAWLALSEGRVRIHGRDGTLRRILSMDEWAPRFPTASEVESLRKKLGDRLEMFGGSRTMLEQVPVDAPERLPALTSVMKGPEGTLWVQRMGDVGDVHPLALNTPDPPTGYGGGVWDVLDPGGRHLGEVVLPPGIRVMDIAAGAVYGITSDSLGVERVVRVDLVR